jgi:hypothetical protein
VRRGRGRTGKSRQRSRARTGEQRARRAGRARLNPSRQQVAGRDIGTWTRAQGSRALGLGELQAGIRKKQRPSSAAMTEHRSARRVEDRGAGGSTAREKRLAPWKSLEARRERPARRRGSSAGTRQGAGKRELGRRPWPSRELSQLPWASREREEEVGEEPRPGAGKKLDRHGSREIWRARAERSSTHREMKLGRGSRTGPVP